MLFQPDGGVEVGGAELAEQPVPAGGAVWIDFEGKSRDYERRLLAMGFHPLSVEDVFTLQHQPKLEEYDEYLFVIIRGIDFNRQRLETLKLAAFVQPGRLVTCHRAPLRSVAAVRRKLEEARQGKGDVVHLFYQVCDELIDYYFPVLEEIGREIEEIEDEIFESPDQAQLERIQSLRRRLATLRRVMLPHRTIFNRLASRQAPFIDEVEAVYFRDVYDNVFRLADATDHLREQLSSAKDTYLSTVSQRTNDVMKVLTVFSAILLPLTFIAGVYGMNFQHMPELESRYGYFLVLGGMAALAIGMLGWFRHKDWL